MSEIELIGNTDAQVWAKTFVDLFGNSKIDEGLMISWFANAIESGRMAAQRGRRIGKEDRRFALEKAVAYSCAGGSSDVVEVAQTFATFLDG